jgi:uncharacterized protein involved in response to NO
MLNHPFFAAPHRVMIAGGAVQLVIAMAIWSVEILARATHSLGPIDWGLPAPWLHAGLMLFSFFPYFIFAFLMTAGPKWTGVRPLTQAEFLPAFFLLSLGWLITYLLQAVTDRGWLGLLVVTLGWGLGCRALFRILQDAEGWPSHPVTAVLATALGGVALIAFTVGWATLDAGWIRAALALGLWGFLATTFFTVVHRMLPIFSINAVPTLRPRATPRLFKATVALLLIHGFLAALWLSEWTWLVDLPLAVILLGLSRYWGLAQSFKVRLLATNHIAFAWMGIAAGLYGIQSALALTGTAWGGLAPLHALSIGFFLSMALSMATRVTLGHSGISPFASPLVWALFLALQLAAVLRVLAEFPALAGTALPASVLLVLTAFVLWFARHGKHLTQPRADGQPG